MFSWSLRPKNDLKMREFMTKMERKPESESPSRTAKNRWVTIGPSEESDDENENLIRLFRNLQMAAVAYDWLLGFAAVASSLCWLMLMLTMGYRREHVCVLTVAHTHVCLAHAYMHKRTCIHIHTYIYIQTNIHRRVYVCMRAHTHYSPYINVRAYLNLQ